MRLALINPNTSEGTTAAMVAIARKTANLASPDAKIEICGITAPFGAPLIADEGALQLAGDAVLSLDPGVLEQFDGIIVAAFGDPGLEALRTRMTVPVVGIAEAGMLSAGAGGRRFSVVTTTPKLVAAIERRADAYGLGGQLCSVRLTEGDLAQTMADPELLVSRLRTAVDPAVSEDGAEAIVIGGGPLAVAARTLASTTKVPLIEPVPEAVRLVVQRIETHPVRT